jgi:uncharacterized protein YijF (DUF1287 family)
MSKFAKTISDLNKIYNEEVAMDAAPTKPVLHNDVTEGDIQGSGGNDTWFRPRSDTQGRDTSKYKVGDVVSWTARNDRAPSYGLINKGGRLQLLSRDQVAQITGSTPSGISI